VEKHNLSRFKFKYVCKTFKSRQKMEKIKLGQEIIKMISFACPKGKKH
jgi:hypothetical protein